MKAFHKIPDWIQSAFFVIVPAIILIGCRTSCEVLDNTEQDRVRDVVRVQERIDSVILRDSIFIEAVGCTIRETRFRDRFHVMRDVRADTIRDTTRVVQVRTMNKVRVVQKVPLLFKITFLGMAFCLVYMLYNMFSKKK